MLRKCMCMVIVVGIVLSFCGCSGGVDKYLEGYTAQDIVDNIEKVASAEKVKSIEIYKSDSDEDVVQLKITDREIIKEWQEWLGKVETEITSGTDLDFPSIGGMPYQIVFNLKDSQLCIGLRSGNAFYSMPDESGNIGIVKITNYDEIADEYLALWKKTLGK